MTMHVGLATPLETWEDEGGQPPPTAHADERLDWLGFLARFYPDARRHDYVSLAAYLEYKKTFGPPIVSSSAHPAERSRS